MKWPWFYLVALALHAVVLFALKPPVAQAAPPKKEKEYIEVTLTSPPPPEIPLPPSEPTPPPPVEPLPEPPPPPEPVPPPSALKEELFTQRVPEPPEPPPTPPPVVPAVKPPLVLPAPGQYLSVTQPSYASRIEPDYPAQARRQHQQGTVVLGLYINALGSLDKVEVVKSSGYWLLDEAAVDALKQSRFHPAYQDQAPVPSHAEVSVKFQLE